MRNNESDIMSDEIEWWEYDDAQEMAEAVAGDIQFIIESAIDARGAAVVALSGGKTPIPIYKKLAEAKLDWQPTVALREGLPAVIAYFRERLAAPDDEASPGIAS